jgi:hypothetical protein
MKHLAKRLSLLLATLFALSLLVTSYHHHNDLKQHPKCIFCKLTQDISSGEQVAHPELDFPEPSKTLFVSGTSTFTQVNLHCPARSRAPPPGFDQASRVTLATMTLMLQAEKVLYGCT